MSSFDVPGATRPKIKRGPSKAVLALAAAASVYTGVLFGRTLVEERSYFSVHSAQKARILTLPGELAKTEREITREQLELLRIQAEIRSRLEQK